MTVTEPERAVIQAARTLAKLEKRRETLKQKFADEIIALDQEIAEAKSALRTFTDGGQEQPTPQVITGGHPGELVGAGKR